MKIGTFSENKQIFKSERHQPLFHEHLQFPNTILGLPHRACTDWQQRLLAAFQVSSCSFCVTSDPATRVFSAWTYVCFAKNKTFPTFNKLLFKVREFENNLAKMCMVINRVCYNMLPEQLSLHCYAVSTHQDELVLEPPLKKILDPPMLIQLFRHKSFICFMICT